MSKQPTIPLVTPMMRLAISAQKAAFFYLYPFRYYLTVNENLSILCVKPRPWSWKLILWLLSVIVLVTIIGTGSTSYIWLGSMLNFHKKKISSFSTIAFNIWLCVFGVASSSALLVIHINPLVLDCINELFKL